MKLDGKEYLTWQEGMYYTGLGKDAFRKVCNEIGATKYFGSRIVRFKKSVIDDYFDNQDFTKEKAARSKEYARTHAAYMADRRQQKK